VRYNKPATSLQSETQVTITSPGKNSWQSGNTVTLAGRTGERGAQVEYRSSPNDTWRSVAVDSSGNFSEGIAVSGLSQGPVHLELRTTVSGTRNIPLYHPFNRGASRQEVRFMTPPPDYGMIHGSKSIIGIVDTTVPIQSIAVSVDGSNFQDIPFASRYGKAWFGNFVDFSTLGRNRGRLAYRITDAAGNVTTGSPGYTINPDPPVPAIIVNTPVDDEIITDAFNISGVAFGEVGIEGVYWRIMGPMYESISPGPAGVEARRKAEAYLENPNVPFSRFSTEQNFQVPIDFTMITDGE
jgi:hypothetical protein